MTIFHGEMNVHRSIWRLLPVSMQNYLYAAKADPRYENASLIADNRVWTALWPIFNKEYQEIESIHTMPYAVVDATDGKTVVSRFETEELLNNYQK